MSRPALAVERRPWSLTSDAGGWTRMAVQNPGHAADRFPKVRQSKGGPFVSFSMEPNEFHMQAMACDNPDCLCHEGTLFFVEVSQDGVPVPRGKAFSVQMDLSTWQARGTDAAPEEIRELVEELRKEPDNPVRAWVAEQERLAREEKKRIAEYRISAQDVREGLLVSFSDILDETGGIQAGGSACSFILPYEGVKYAVEEFYCPNPDCNCKEVHLSFWGPKGDSEKTTIGLYLRGTMTLRGRMVVEEWYECSEKQARKMMKALREQEPDLPEHAKRHYRIVKEIGRRSLQESTSEEVPAGAAETQGIRDPSAPVHGAGRIREEGSRRAAEQDEDALNRASMRLPAIEPSPRRKDKPGRNQPCPCGSGKKYKKCCGR